MMSFILLRHFTSLLHAGGMESVKIVQKLQITSVAYRTFTAMAQANTIHHNNETIE